MPPYGLIAKNGKMRNILCHFFLCYYKNFHEKNVNMYVPTYISNLSLSQLIYLIFLCCRRENLRILNSYHIISVGHCKCLIVRKKYFLVLFEYIIPKLIQAIKKSSRKLLLLQKLSSVFLSGDVLYK